MQKIALVFAAVAATFVAQAVDTWTVFHEDHVPFKNGVAVGETVMTPVQQLTNAIAQAAGGSTIIIKPGTYMLADELVAQDTFSYAHFLLTTFNASGAASDKSIHLKGEDETPWNEKTPEQETVLDGGGMGVIFYGHANSGRSSSFRNLTFANGKYVKSSGGKNYAYGGGAITFAATQACFPASGKGIATNCVFRDCSSETSGGATFYVGVFDSCYSNCTATVNGGGAYGSCKANGNTPGQTNMFVNCTFADCQATKSGGALYCEHLNDLPGCFFLNCTAGSQGGAVYTCETVGDLSGCVFTNNVSTESDAGALYAVGTVSSITNCQFIDNASKNVGGALYLNGVGAVVDCDFIGNRSMTSGSGGAVYNPKDTGRLIGCSFVGNVSQYGGGGYCCSKTIGEVRDCEFRENTAPVSGGGLYGSTLVIVSNCTFVANSTAGDGAGLNCSTVTNLIGCSFVGNHAAKNAASMNCTGYTFISGCTFSNNVADVNYAGVYAATYASAGTVENCVFYNNTNQFANVGSQISGAAKAVGCTFGGYGDYMRVHGYDRCVFDGCSFDYDNYGGGMIEFSTATGEGYLRNCLFKNNNVHIYVKNDVGGNVEIANCTFVGNAVSSALNLGTKSMSPGYLFYSFRGGSDPAASGKARPSTNIIVNCAFVDNTRDGERNDVNFYVTGTSVATPAVNVFSNSVYEIASFVNNPMIQGNLIVGRAKFTAGDPKYGDDVPYYMPKRISDARKAGLWFDWMAGAKDLAGADMPSAAPVDLGCYQCTLPVVGGLLLLR